MFFMPPMRVATQSPNSAWQAVFAEHCGRHELERIKQVHLAILATVTKDRNVSESLFEEAKQIDTGFHTQMVRSLENPIIDSIYQTNHERALLIRLLRLKASVPYVKTTFEEHLKIIDAHIDSDVNSAKATLNEHLDKAIQRAMGF